MPETLFDRIVSTDSLAKAAAAHRAQRPWSVQPPSADLAGLRAALLEGRFQFQPPDFHYVTLNKPVLAAEFAPADWIVQQALATGLTGHFRKSNVPCCGYRVADWEILEDQRYTWASEKKWCVRADIRQFFQGIGHGTLLAVVSERLACTKTLLLLRRLLLALDEGSLLFSAKYPAHLHQAGLGLPIGTELPYVLADAFLHPVDLKMSGLCGGFYGRYMDDLVFFADSEAAAHDCLGQLSAALLELGLVLHAEKTAVFACK